MRRFPCSWQDTWTKLGFRRKKHRGASYRRISQLESLEIRRLLAVTATPTSFDRFAEPSFVEIAAPAEYRAGHFTLTSADWTGKESGTGARRTNDSFGIDSGLQNNDPTAFDPDESWSFRLDQAGYLMGIEFDDFTVSDGDRAMLRIGDSEPIPITADDVREGYWRSSEPLQFAAGDLLRLDAVVATDADRQRAAQDWSGFIGPIRLHSAWRLKGLNVIGHEESVYGGYIDLTENLTNGPTTAPASSEATPRFAALLAGVDVNLTGFTVDPADPTRLQVTYTITGGNADESIWIRLHKSVNGSTVSGDPLLSYEISNPAYLTEATHVVSIPVEGFADVEEDYYLMAVADVSDSSSTNNKRVFSGGVFVSDGIVHFQGSTSYVNDNVVIQAVAGTYQILWNGVIKYSTTDPQAFSSVRARTHGGNDTVDIDDPSLDIGVWAFGGAGNDNIYSGAADDRLYGGAGYDTLYSFDGEDWIDGEASGFGASGYGYGYAGSYLFGGNDDDEIRGGFGGDYIRGGNGDDLLFGGDEPNGYGGFYSGGYGDILYGDSGADVLFGGSGDDQLYGGGSEGDVLHGEGGNDYLFGTSGNDTLHGGDGSDTVHGNAGDDEIDGGSGTNTLYGGLDNDVYRLDNQASATTTIIDTGGVDAVDLSKNWIGPAGAVVDLGLEHTAGRGGSYQPQNIFDDGATIVTLRLGLNADIENLVGTAFDDTLLGNDLSNELRGNAGDDAIDGAELADSAVGGVGYDSEVIDDDSIQSSVGTWSIESASTAYVGRQLRHAIDPAATGDEVTWSFSGLPKGRYKVYATWASDPTLAVDAPFEVNVSGKTYRVAVDQQQSPSGDNYLGTQWYSFGVFLVEGSTLDVRLGTSTTGDVIADAVRIVEVESASRVIDFDTDAFGAPLGSGDLLAEQWADWGVHLSTGDATNHPLMVFNSASPTGGDTDLGSPNQDFGGPGVGDGGGAGEEGENATALDQVLIVSADGNSADPKEYGKLATATFTFDTPITIDHLSFLNAQRFTQTLWGIDEDDGQLFSLTDYEQPETFIDHGKLYFASNQATQWNNPLFTGDVGRDVESFTLTSTGVAYMVVNPQQNSKFTTPHLLKLDINSETPNEVVVIGPLSGANQVNGLAVDPENDDIIYGVDLVSNGADRLISFAPELTDNAVSVSNIGSITNSDGTIQSTDSEDLVFAPNGDIYVTDNADDHLYRVQLQDTNGAISIQSVSLADNNEAGGTGNSNVKIESLGWDAISNRMIATDDDNDEIISITIGSGGSANDGGNVVLSALPASGGDAEKLSDVEGVDFVPHQTDLPAGTITLYADVNGSTPIGSPLDIASLGPNGFQKILVGVAGVRRVDVELINVGAITELAFTDNAPNIIPELDLNGVDQSEIDYSTTYVHTTGPVDLADSDALIADADLELIAAGGPEITSLEVRIANLSDGSDEVLSYDPGALPTGVTVESGAGLLFFSGLASPSDYTDLLRTIRYENVAAAPTLGDRTVEFIASDRLVQSSVAITTVTVAQAPTVILEEGNRLVTEYRYDIPAGAAAVEIPFSALSFDNSSGNPADFNDAFEIALLDSEGRPAKGYDGQAVALGTIGDVSDALFNLTQRQDAILAPGVQLLTSEGLPSDGASGMTSGVVRIRTDGLAGYQVVVRLVNNDADDGTHVTLSSTIDAIATIPGSGAGAVLTAAAQSVPRTTPGIDFATLKDVTNSFGIEHQLTTTDSSIPDLGGSRVVTRLKLTKLPGLQVRNDLLLAVRPPAPQAPGGTPASTQLWEPDGLLPYGIAGLPQGTPYVWLSSLMDSTNGFYDAGAVLGQVELAFLHEGNERFDVEWIVLGELNDPPEFTSEPYAQPRGNAYPVEVLVNPIDDPTVMLEVVARGGNAFEYIPTFFDLNGDDVHVEVIAGPRQDDTGESNPNNLVAVDTDGDGHSDVVRWTPTTADEGIHTVTLRAVDEHDGYAAAYDQTFLVRVVLPGINRPPSYQSPAVTYVTYGKDYDYPSHATDPDGDSLAYLQTSPDGQPLLGAKPQDYVLSLADLDDDLSGETINYLTFLNNQSGGVGVGMYSNVRLYESDWGETERISFDYERFEAYGSGSNSDAVQVAGDLSVVRIEDDTRTAYKLATPYTVTENTVLAFTFSSEVEGATHGIGVDTDPASIDDDRWFRLYGSDASTTVAAGGSPSYNGDAYGPEWSEDQSANFTVDADGAVKWANVPFEAVGKWVHVDLYAEETDSADALSGSPLRAHQAYELFVHDSGVTPPQVGDVDLTIAFDEDSTSSLRIDGQTLEIGGVVTANVTNLGTGIVNGPFSVTFFEDLDFDGVYTPDRDNTLGETSVEQHVQANASIVVAATLSGQVRFGGPASNPPAPLSGVQIYAYVDNGNAITETNETNNYAGSKDGCILPADSSPLSLEISKRIRFIPALGQHLESLGMPIVAHLNDEGDEGYQDDVPDIVFASIDGRLNAIDGTYLLGPEVVIDSEDVFLWQSPPTILVGRENVPAVGDIDGDLLPEVVTLDASGTQLLAFEHDGTLKWSMPSNLPLPPLSAPWGGPSIANLDYSGPPEIIVGSMVYNHLGSVIAVGQGASLGQGLGSLNYIYGGNELSFGPLSIVADIDPASPGMEIIAGNTAYRADGSVYWHATKAAGYSVDIEDGYAAIADLDPQNPGPEIALVTNGYLHLLRSSGEEYLRIPLIGYVPGIDYPEEHEWHYNEAQGVIAGGPPTIGNFDGDAELEIGVATTSSYEVYNASGELLWIDYHTVDYSSGVTGSTLFDFNSDGRVEVVYRDEARLYIFDGPGNSGLSVRLAELEVGSRTALEYPVIADIDGDNEAEIVVTADFGMTELEDNDGVFDRSGPEAGLLIIESAGDAWADAREIWNQHAYHITNVNDDATIPVVEQNSWEAHNTYRTSALPDLDVDPLAAPDLVPSWLRIDGSLGVQTLTVRVGNGGLGSAPKDVVVRFYNGDVFIGEKRTSRALEAGEYEDVRLSHTGIPYILNDINVVVDPPNTNEFGDVRECREDNNAYGMSAPLVNDKPEFDYTPILTAVEGLGYNDTAHASDSNKLRYSMPVKPAGMQINPTTGEITWTPIRQDALKRFHPVTVYVEDGYGGADLLRYTIQVLSDNEAPVIEPIADQAVAIGDTLSVDFVAYDPNGGDVLTYSIRAVTPLPYGVSAPSITSSTTEVDEYQLQWSGAPEGGYWFEVVFDDGRLGVDRELLFVSVYNGNEPPAWRPEQLAVDPVILNQEWEFEIWTIDDSDGDSRTTSDAGYVIDIDDAAKQRGFVYDQALGKLSWTPTAVETAYVTLTATDADGLTGPALDLELPVNVLKNAGGNEPARITSEPTQLTATVGRPWVYRVEADDTLDTALGRPVEEVTIRVVSFKDADGNDLTGQLVGDIESTGDGATSLIIRWEPDEASWPITGPATLVVTANDEFDHGGDDYTQTIPITLIENSAPFITKWVGEARAPVGVETTFPFELLDFDGDDVRVELLTPAPGDGVFYQGGAPITGRFTASANPESPTQFELRLTPTEVGIASVRVRVTDEAQKTSERTIQLEVYNPADAPTGGMGGSLAYSQRAAVGAQYVAQVTPDENNSVADDKLEYWLLYNGTEVQVIPASTDESDPVGLSIDPETGRITWTPIESQLSQEGDTPYQFTVRIVDTTLGSTISPVDITTDDILVVSTVSNTPPEFRSDPKERPFSLTQPFVYPLKGYDAENHPITFHHVSGPGDLVGDTFTWTPTVDDVGKSRVVVLRVDDPYGPGEQQTITLSLTGESVDGGPSGPNSLGNAAPRIVSTPVQPGPPGADYIYRVRGEDSDSGFSLVQPSQTLGASSDYSWTDHGDGTATFVWKYPGVSTTETFTFGIVDEHGKPGESQSFTLTLGGSEDAVIADTPIRIVGAQPRVVAAGSRYDYTIGWDDPDVGNGGPAPMFTVEAAYLSGDSPDGGAAASRLVASLQAGGVFSWDTIADDIGVYSVSITATQGSATTGSASHTVTYSLEVFDPELNPNLRPQLTPTDGLTAAIGGSLSFQVPGTDDGPFDFFLVDDEGKLVSEYDGFTIDLNGLVTWETPDSAFVGATYPFTVDLLDDAGQRAAAPVTYSVEVVGDAAPTVVVVADTRRQEAGGVVVFSVFPQDDVEVTSVRFWIDGIEKTLDANNRFTYAIPVGTPTDTVIVANATVLDDQLQEGSGSTTVTVREENTTAPEVSITTPSGFVYESVFPLNGRVYDQDDNVVFYEITATPTGGGEPIVLLRQDARDPTIDPSLLNGNYLAIGSDDIDEDLVTISPFSLANGVYTIKVTARDEGDEERSASIVVGIDSEQKLGNFALSFTDLTVPIAGYPLSIVRNYDSQQHNVSGEFGYGWSLDIVSGKLSYLPYEESVEEVRDGSAAMQGGDVVTLTLPGGEEHRFIVTPVPAVKANPLEGWIHGATNRYALAFLPDPGQASRLDLVSREPYRSTYYALERYSYPENFDYLLTTRQLEEGFVGVIGELTPDNKFTADGDQRSGPINMVTLNADFRLTARNGAEYIFDSATFELRKIIDPEGIVVEFDSNGYRATATNEDGQPVTMGEIKINRGVGGRIESVEDGAGRSIRYEYEGGLLKRFYDRTWQDGAAPTAEFFYGEDGEGGEPNYSAPGVSVPDRLLTSIRNAASDRADVDARTLTVGWDSDGRLFKLGDAGGGEATFTYTENLGGIDSSLNGFSLEVVSDAHGVPTEIVRDATGRVARRIQLVEDAGVPGDGTDDVWLVTVYAYDDLERQIGESKPFTVDESMLGADERFTQLPGGETPATFTADPDDTAFNADYWSSVEKYDADGHLVLQVDAAGKRTTYSDFNDKYGFAGTVVGPDGATTITESYDVIPGHSRTQTTTLLNSKGENSVTQLFFEGYNLRSVSQGRDGANLTGASYLDYDPQLRLAATTDASGLTTYFVYDKADNQVLSYYAWDDPSDGIDQTDYLIVTRTVYDEENRVVGAQQYAIDSQSTGVTSLGIEQQLLDLGIAPLWETSTVYNDAGQAVKSVDRYGVATYTLYDARGSVVETRTETQDPGGVSQAWVVTRTAYDVNGRMVAVTDPFVVRNALTPLDDLFNPEIDTPIDPATGATVADGARITHTLYDLLGRVVETRRVDIVGEAIAATLVVDATDPANNLYRATFAYDDALQSYDDPASQVLSVTTTAYDTQGRVNGTASYAMADQTGTEVRTYYLYDEAGRQIKVATAYDADGDGSIEVNLVDGSLDFNDPGPEAFVTETEYDPVTGRQSATIDAGGVRTEYEYDDLGRVTKTTADAGGLNVVTSATYDYAGRRLTSTDALKQTTIYGYDPATSRLTSVTLPRVNSDATGSKTGSATYEYGYDRYGNQTLLRDPMDDKFVTGGDNKETVFTFDELGRQTSRTLPDGLIETMLYDNLGRVVRSTDFEGRTVDYVYDGYGRLEEKRYFDIGAPPDQGPGLDPDFDEAVDYVYDALGRTLEVLQDRDASGSLTAGDRLTENDYDEERRLIRVTTPEGIVNYAYDDLGRQTSTWTGDYDENDPGAPTETDYAYDPLGRLETVTSVRLAGNAVNQQTNYAYDTIGNLQYVFEPGHASYYQYDSINRLDALTHYVEDGVPGFQGSEQLIATFDYEVRADGKRTGAIEKFYDGSEMLIQENALAWSYDEAGRLVTETLSSDVLEDYTDSYGYDLAGNRLRYSHDGAASDKLITYAYDENDRLLWEKTDNLSDGSINESTVYSYDGTRRSHIATYAGGTEDGVGLTPLEATDYEYNRQGRLSEVDDGSQVVEYDYDDSGIQIARRVQGGAEKLYLVDHQNHTGYAQTLEEKADGATVLRAYLVAHAVLGQRDAAPVAAYLGFLADGGGSTRGVLLDATGQITDGEVYAYDAYGVRLDGHTAKTDFLYRAERRDGEFDYLRARPYDFRTGTFLRSDDYIGSNQDPQTLHKYLYTHGDPVNGRDPSGLFTQALGYAAEAAITSDHKASFPFPLWNITYGAWARLPGSLGAFSAKPDILNHTDLEYNEIKPLSPSGIVSAIAQMSLRNLQFGALGYVPDIEWRSTQPGYGTAGLVPIVYFNISGVVFYTDALDVAEDLLAVKALSLAPAAWKLLSSRAGTLVGNAGKIPGLASARVSIDGNRLNSHLSIGTLLASMGVA